jgi:hypothetical protein
VARHLAEHLRDLTVPLGLSSAVPVDHEPVAGRCAEVGAADGHETVLLTVVTQIMVGRTPSCIGVNADLGFGELPNREPVIRLRQYRQPQRLLLTGKFKLRGDLRLALALPTRSGFPGAAR